MKKILEDIFGVDEDGNLSIAELTAGNVWMQMLTDCVPVEEKEDDLWDDELADYDLEDYDPEEVELLTKGLTEAEKQPLFDEIDDISEQEPAEKDDALQQMKCALRKAGFDAADVDMLYEDEIQEALEEAGLSWQDALTLDSDILREELLYHLSAELSQEMQLWANLLDVDLNPKELAQMSCEERENVLEDAGLEPFDYETFDFQRFIFE